MIQTIKVNGQQDQSMNFDDNYNQQEFLKQQNGNNKIQKLSIMDDFNQLKLHYLNQQHTTETEVQNTLAQYYAKCKQKTQDRIPDNQKDKQTPNPNKPQQNHFNSKLNKPSPILPQHHGRSASDNNILNQQQQTNRLHLSTHQRNPSYGQNIKKPLQQTDLNDNKRNYSSVQQKKKLLQPSKNSINQYQNPSMKDYFGQDNFVNKKVHGKNFIKNQPKTLKQIVQSKPSVIKKQPTTNINPLSYKPISNNKQNSLKQSNLINMTKKVGPCQIPRNSKIQQKQTKPRIIMYKKIIDLSQSTQAIMQAFKNQQRKSDYEMFSQSQSSIDESEDLFRKALVDKKKSVQNVQSSNYNYLQPLYNKQKNILQKQYIQSPINITNSPNPTNMQKSSIFQKRQIYRC